MGLLGILLYNAFTTEQPLTELRTCLPLLVLEQHCRSVLRCWCHSSLDKAECALSPSVITAPSSTEKKPQINGHASPSHLTANNHAGKQSKSMLASVQKQVISLSNAYFLFPDIFISLSVAEGYMKTDDRMRLAKERREEREKSLGGWCPFTFDTSVNTGSDLCALMSSEVPATAGIICQCTFPAKFVLMQFFSQQFNWLWKTFYGQWKLSSLELWYDELCHLRQWDSNRVVHRNRSCSSCSCLMKTRISIFIIVLSVDSYIKIY